MSNARRVSLLLVLPCVLATCVSAAEADDTASIQAALAETALESEQALAEMKAFIAPRLIAPPAATDRAQWQAAADRLRRDVLDKIVFRGEAARWRDARCGVEWLDTLPGGPGYSIRKFRYEALPGMWIPGLLYLPEKLSGQVPLVLNVNGHDPLGKAAPYKQLRSINVAKRGMLALNVEWFGMGQLRTDGFAHGRMNQLELCGASGLAPFYLALVRALDVGLALEHADPKRVAVSGLSGGGWQTILVSSLDPRVTLANPVAGYGSFHTNLAFGDMGDSEQAPTDLATVADYTHLTALRAPRPTLLTYNVKDDCCFKSGHTLEPLVHSARPIFALYGASDHLRSHVNHDPGTHNFELDNRQQFYKMLGDFFFPGDATFVRDEIPSEPELKKPEELQVPLPEGNVDFHRLAQALAAELAVDAAQSGDREKSRAELRSLLRVPDYGPATISKEGAAKSDARARIGTFHVGESWTLPATWFVPQSADGGRTVLVVADAGRAGQAAEVSRQLAAGNDVIAADLLLCGESQLKAQDPDYTYPLLIAAAGQRGLGIQAAQLVALARWAQAERKEPVQILALGPRTSAAALVAAALETQAIAGIEAVDALPTFKQLLERDVAVEAMPELFAFGLLAEFDVPRLVALAGPSRVVLRGTAGEPKP